MPQSNISTRTPYDEAAQTKRLQLLKTFVPYAGGAMQKGLAVLIPLLECQTVLGALNASDNRLTACSVPEGGRKMTMLLSEIKPFLSAAEQEMIDNLLNIMCLMENYEIS